MRPVIGMTCIGSPRELLAVTRKRRRRTCGPENCLNSPVWQLLSEMDRHDLVRLYYLPIYVCSRGLVTVLVIDLRLNSGLIQVRAERELPSTYSPCRLQGLILLATMVLVPLYVGCFPGKLFWTIYLRNGLACIGVMLHYFPLRVMARSLVLAAVGATWLITEAVYVMPL